MSRSQSEQGQRTWWLSPRDPLVFGDGARVPALVPRRSFFLPPQGTLAGMVRTRCAADLAQVSEEEARDLLQIRIRGPWLAEQVQDTGEVCLWLPVPEDVRVSPGRGCHAPYPAPLLDPGEGEGTLGPRREEPDLALVELPDRDGEVKTDRPDFAFWPFETVLAWSLGVREEIAPIAPGCHPIVPEDRIHVAIDDDSQTAEPEALWSTGGLRFRPGFGIALEVVDERAGASGMGPPPGAKPELLVLGAESRTVECRVREGRSFPEFSCVRGRYVARIGELQNEIRGSRANCELGLRVQLLTPGAFAGWEPAWPPGLDLAAKLRAVAMDRFVPISGWNLQAGGPRRVRRLAPAGTVYFLAPFDETTLFEACEILWETSLCPGEWSGEPEPFRAQPSADGYGQVLPAPCLVPRRTK